ncbi:MAG: CpaF family protein [Bacteroidales bacterium]|nr:CpaF family protein [Bacteroidales bacterium]
MGPESQSEKPADTNIKLAELKNNLVKSVVLKSMADPPLGGQYLELLRNSIEKFIRESGIPLSDKQEKEVLTDVFNYVASYGPIQPYLDDPTISEIMVNGYDQIFIERNGKLIETGLKYDNEYQLVAAINHIVHPLGRFVNYNNPTMDARLPDGSRVNVIIPPVSHKGPHITIRKFLKDKLTMDQIISLDSITKSMAKFIEACIISRLNILISGNTSSGKTTLLNIVSAYIPDNERIITIEDSAELNLKQRHVVSLEAKPPDTKGEGRVEIRELVKNSLRMRPDRILVGEVRSGEALDMLQAMNTGHDGSITTIHSNSPRDTISRLETMALMSGLEIPIYAIRKQIASAIQLIVHLSRLQDGTRKVTHITEVVGMEGDIVTLTDIFQFEQTGLDNKGNVQGQLMPTGLRPQFTPKLEAFGYKLDPEIFMRSLIRGSRF